jgi:hypothetical protein
MVDPGRDGADVGGFQQAHDFARLDRGGEVDVLHLDPQQRVAHGPADIAHVAGAQHGDQAF